MKIKEIEYLVSTTGLVENCLDVLVILEDNYCTDQFCYLVNVVTPQFLSALMEKTDFVPPGYPYIIVSKLTDEVIRAAIQAFIDTEDDLYWMQKLK
jgi:hypothetical protein